MRTHTITALAAAALLALPALAAPTATDLTFPGGAEGVTLAGTLTLPDGASPDTPVPGAILISGSGAQDRDESIGTVKPFKILADALTKHGYAVLRYDDRGTSALGIGKSTGDYQSSTTADFANDALAAINTLAANESVDADRITVIGHSTGGLVTAHLLRDGKVPHSAVLIASPAIRGAELIIDQSKRMLDTMLKLETPGVTQEIIDQSVNTQRSLLTAAASDDEDALRSAAEKVVRDEIAKQMPDADPPQEMLEGGINQVLAPFNAPWMAYFIRYNPVKDLESATVPVLALYGVKDLQVHPSVNAPIMRGALKRSGVEQSEVVVLDDANHLFQTATTGLPDEYTTLKDTMNAKTIKAITDWLDSLP